MASMASPLRFAFSDEQRKAVYAEAHRRQAVNSALGLKGRNNGPASGSEALRLHLLGAAGEMAVAALLDMEHFLYQETMAKRGSADLPPNIDVKTRARHYYDLVVQLDEKPGKIFVLVTIENRQTFVHGWIKSEDAMKDQWKREHVKGRPAFFVPKHHLQPLSTLL
jgi:hypothetical protein